MNKTKSVIAELISNRADLFELILVAVLLALSVNLVSSAFSEIFVFSPLVILGIGLLLGLSVIGYSVSRLFKSKHRSRTFRGFFIYNEKRNEVIEVPRYNYSEKLRSCLRGAFSENDAFKALWEKEPLSGKFSKRHRKDSIGPVHTRSMDLIAEATEYFVLDKLSSHLSDYFSDKKQSSNGTIKEFYRNDIPDVLLSNRFLELFSRPMEERSSFTNHPFDDLGIVVYAASANGALFDRFDLNLPAETKLSRQGKNQLEIDTSRFSFKISVDFSGFNTFIPFEFHQYILNEKDPMEISDFAVYIAMDIEFKNRAFFSSRGWDYYYWVDSFLEDFSESFDEDAYFRNIGWNQVLTLLEFLAPRLSKTVSSRRRVTSRKERKPKNAS